MINFKMVGDMFLEWRKAGLRSGAASKEEYKKKIVQFFSRYVFLQPEELALVKARVLELGRWPRDEEMTQLVGQIMAENMQGLDYSVPYARQEGEDYDTYIVKIGRALFPQKGADWYYLNATFLRIVYQSGYCCHKCDGTCPYGNRMVGEVSPVNGSLQVKRMAGLCPRATVTTKGTEVLATPDQAGIKGISYAVDLTDYSTGIISEEAMPS